MENYKWSSFPDYIGQDNFPSVTSREFLLEFFGGQERYRKEMIKWIKERNDNIEKIKVSFPEELTLRKDAFILSLATAISTQGFELTDLQLNEESAVATVAEITDGPPEERRIHASQFVYPLWCQVQKPTVIVKYVDKTGKVRLTTVARGVDCKRIADGEIPFSDLASLVEFEIDGKSIPRQ